MHIFLSIVTIVGAIAILGIGFLSVLRDLLERFPYEAPLLDEAPMVDEVHRPTNRRCPRTVPLRGACMEMRHPPS
jgi:hypothetical protein